MTRLVGVGAALLAAWLAFLALSARSEAAAAKRDAWEARTESARVVAQATGVVSDLTRRVDDLERLTMELQDGMQPDAYRYGFPEPEDEHQPRRRWRCVGKACSRVADAGQR